MAKYIALGLIRFYGVFLSESDFHVKSLKGLNRRQFFDKDTSTYYPLCFENQVAIVYFITYNQNRLYLFLKFQSLIKHKDIGNTKMLCKDKYTMRETMVTF